MEHRVTCCISKATRTHIPTNRAPTHTHARAFTHTQIHKYVILIAFPRQEELSERAALLRHTYIACRVLDTLNCTRSGVDKTSQIGTYS